MRHSVLILLVALVAFVCGDATNFDYNVPGPTVYHVNLLKVNPSVGPLTGGLVVTLWGSPLGNGFDVTSVTLAGIPATILSQNMNQVVVQSGAAVTAGTGSVVVNSNSCGSDTLASSFTYKQAGSIALVTPITVPAGSAVSTVTISGAGLGSGTDIVSVKLAGVPAIIVSQTVNSVVVKASPAVDLPASLGVISGVSVTSTSVGTTSVASLFSYTNDAVYLTNHIVFNGNMYAVLDNTDPLARTANYDATSRSLPAGWSLAPDVDASVAAVMGPRYQFGCQCVVLASGRSVNTITGATCATSGQLVSSNGYTTLDGWAKVLVTKPAPLSPLTWESAPNPTRVFAYQGYAFAAMDNTDPFDGSATCQDAAVKLPAGWTIATPTTQALGAVGLAQFGANCLVFADGLPRDHSGGLCSTTPNLLSVGSWYAVPFCSMKVLLTQKLPTATNAVTLPSLLALPGRTVGMRVLLVGDATDTQIIAAQTTLTSMEIPWDFFNIVTSSAAQLQTVLSDGTVNGNYQGIVVSIATHLQTYPDTANVLNDYCRLFRVRLVTLYGYPSFRMSIAALSSSSADVSISFTTAFQSNPAVSGLVKTLSAPLSGVFYYPSAINDATIAKPVLNFVSGQTILGVAAAEVNWFDGRRETHFFFDQANWSLASAVFGHYWAQWVTKNVYVGARRSILSTQIDDLLLTTDLWSPVTNAQTIPDFRVSAASLKQHVTFMKEINKVFPKGSEFVIELGLNGFGNLDWLNNGQKSDPLLSQMATNLNDFMFESHTWTHRDLDANTQNLAGDIDTLPEHNTTYEEAVNEIVLNRNWAKSKLFNTAAKLKRWADDSLITPAITGLFNGPVLKGLYDSGIRSIVSDQSFPAKTVGPNPYRALYTTKERNGFAGILIVPRFATEIYYCTSLPAENMALYNTMYRSHFGYDSTIDQAYQREAAAAVLHLMYLRHDPYMFHQANLHTFSWPDPITGKTSTVSLVYLWLRWVARAYTAYSTLPVITYNQHDLAEIYLDAMARDDCQANARMTLAADNTVSSVIVTAEAGNCDLRITGLTAPNQNDITVQKLGLLIWNVLNGRVTTLANVLKADLAAKKKSAVIVKDFNACFNILQIITLNLQILANGLADDVLIDLLSPTSTLLPGLADFLATGVKPVVGTPVRTETVGPDFTITVPLTKDKSTEILLSKPVAYNI